MSWQSELFSYLDEGTLYLTPSQRRAVRLIVQVSVESYEPPVSLSFKRNPPQSIWGYATGVSDAAVVFEKAVRFDYETIYDDTDIRLWMSNELCRYFSLIQRNLRELHVTIPNALPYNQFQIQGLVPYELRQLDSIRFKMDRKGQFQFAVFWEDITQEAPCIGERIELPDVPAVAPTPRGPQPGSTSPSENPVMNQGQPVGPLTPRPTNAFPGDFGDRNPPPSRPIQNYQRGRVSTGYNPSCEVVARVAAWPTPPGQQPPFFAGITSSTPSIPPVTFTQTGSGFCGNGMLGNFSQAGTVIEPGAIGILTFQWPVFARYTDGSWEVVAP